jgi:Spy/CpxP family protein refolding chaperone
MLQSIKLYLALALVIAFLAGLATGRLQFFGGGGGGGPEDRGDERRRDDGKRGGRRPVSRMCVELGLDGEQRQKVLEIWSQALREVPPPPIKALRAAEDERKQAVIALLTPEQKAAYERLHADFDAKVEQLHAPGRAAFERAHERTKQLLTEEQRQKYEEMFAGKDGGSAGGGSWRGAPFGGGGRGRGSPSGTKPE